MKQIESIKEFGGYLNRYSHLSECCGCEMVFSVFLPAQSVSTAVPSVYFLSGLTCTDDNVRTKAGAQRYAAELGIALIMPDTSPRGDEVADVAERYDLGQGAGFYVDATQSPWAKHYQMYSYVTKELPALIAKAFPQISEQRSIMGHSMGGHGALVCALRNANFYQSVSAFAPICHPTKSPWGQACFSHYLGENTDDWQAYDASLLMEKAERALPLLIDQGTDDEFLAEQLYPTDFSDACEQADYPITLRFQMGYDHSYHFIASFIGEHLLFHAQAFGIIAPNDEAVVESDDE